MGDPGIDVLGEIVRVRRRISLVRRTLAPHRAALAGLARPELGADDDLGAPWPGLVDRIEHASQSIEALRTALLGTYDIHMGRDAQRANDVMKLLTLLSAVLLPAVVLAGIMGMNFQRRLLRRGGQLLDRHRRDGRVQRRVARRGALAPLVVSGGRRGLSAQSDPAPAASGSVVV